MMKHELPEQDARSISILALSGAVVLALVLFMVTLTIGRNDLSAEVVEYRQVLTLNPPPMAPQSIEPEVQKEEELPPPPEAKDEFQELTLNQLELSLSPGIGDALSMGITQREFDTEVDAVADIKKVFTFDDLERAPRVLVRGSFVWPESLRKRGIREGHVQAYIRIDTSGRVTVLKIESSSHPKFEKPVRKLLRETRYEVIERDGVPIVVEGSLPIPLRLN